MTDPTAAGKTEPPAPGSHRRSERRIPTARETLATLPELDDVEPLSGRRDEVDFEAHDTIPAPPWLEDDVAAPSAAPSKQ